MFPKMEMRMTWGKASQFGKDGITLPFVEYFGLKVERAQPRANATALNSHLFAGEEQLLAESFSPLFRCYPQPIDHQP